MARMKPPVITEKAIPVLTDDTLKKLLRACVGREFTELRDTAIIRVLIDTGMRREEVATILVDDLDLDTDSVSVTRKGRRPATLNLSAKTCQALERYLRSRSHQPLARRPELWLGEKHRGPLTADGVRQMLDRRCDQAGIPHIHPHQFRHTAADYAMRSRDVRQRSHGHLRLEVPPDAGPLRRGHRRRAGPRGSQAPQPRRPRVGPLLSSYPPTPAPPVPQCGPSLPPAPGGPWFSELALLLGQVRLSSRSALARTSWRACAIFGSRSADDRAAVILQGHLWRPFPHLRLLTAYLR